MWLWLVLVVSVLAGMWTAGQERSIAPRGQAIAINVVPVPLNPRDPAATAVGDFSYAGGLRFSSRQTDRLHELSDLIIRDAHRITAVGDGGILFDARLVLDGAGRLVGITDARLSLLIGTDGRPLSGENADAEGIALLRGGDLLITFERNHRIWRYPAGGGFPQPVPSPRATFPSNGGMEALTSDPEATDGGYLVGGEDSGETWTCRLTAACTKAQTVKKPAEFGLVAMNRLPGGLMAYLLRAYDPARGARVTLQIVRGATEIAQMNLAMPMTVDNFEGLASVVGPDGRRRFYLLSDDNASSDQRTLLLAFDWQPQ